VIAKNFRKTAPVGPPLVGHTDAVSSVAFSPDGHRIVTGAENDAVLIWDAGTGKPIGQPLAVRGCRYSAVAAFPVHGSREVTTTLAIYTHLFDDDHAETMAALGAMGQEKPKDSNVVALRR
jgi:WD40 repeat protein